MIVYFTLIKANFSNTFMQINRDRVNYLDVDILTLEKEAQYSITPLLTLLTYLL